ncbi:hyaluronate lyase N-terminal domain-containing protein [Rhizobium sp. CAU 1783]
MSTQIQHRRGTTVQHASFTGAVGEVTVDTTKKTVVVHDGATLGGTPLAKEADVAAKADATATATALASKADAAAVATALTGKADATPTASALAARVRTDTSQGLTAAEQGQARANIGADFMGGLRDKLINGNGAISQRSYGTVADDTYWCDRHYVLTQTAPITPTLVVDVANGLPSMMRLTQSQAAAQRMGNAQIVEASVSKPMRGQTVTLGGKLRCSAGQAIRFAVLEWTGAADAVTSDVINSWTSGTYTAGNFFLASNLVVAAVGAITPTANAIAKFALTAAISAACNNIIVLYWTEGTAAQNVTLDMAWGLVEGDASVEDNPFRPRHPQQELALCQRYFEKSYDPPVGPGTATTTGQKVAVPPAGGVSALRIPIEFKVTKRTSSPTIVAYSPFNGASGFVYDVAGAANRTAAIDSIGASSASIMNNVTTTSQGTHSVHWTADSEL